MRLLTNRTLIKMEMEILDISSDSNETIIESKNEKLSNEIDKPFSKQDDDLDYLVNKYLKKDKKPISPEISPSITFPEDVTYEKDFSHLKPYNKRCIEESPSTFNCNVSSFENAELPSFSSTKRVKTDIFTNSDEHETGVCIDSASKKNQKEEKERIRLEKLELKEQKKEEERRNKAIKDALANHYKNMRPENCIKFIKVQIDETLEQEDFSKYIKAELNKNDISFSTKLHDTSSIITWKTQLDSHILNIDGQLIDASEGAKINEVLLIMKWNDFLVNLHNKTFLSNIEKACVNLTGKKIILAIYGLGKYYQYQKRNKNREYKEDISSKSYKNSKDERIYGNIPTVSRRTVEYALTEIQLLYSISHKMVENEPELASFVFQITKSIAQAPYKKQKQEQFIQSRWFMSEDNKNCVKVDKNGNGLSRLWKQTITTFPLASLETAEAIASVYPTPLSLFEAYEKISDTSEGEKLLQDIPIRRAAGPISTMRKIGPELSRKMYYFFTSTNPDKVM